MNLHPWINAVHLVSAVVWIGGMLMTAMVAQWSLRQNDKSTTLNLLNDVRSWNRRMTSPAMIVLWIAGIAMLVAHGQMPHLWLIVKIVFVVLLSGLHGFLSATLRRLANGETLKRTGALNNATLLLVLFTAVITVLAVVRPF
ncbi:CopD family protein [Kosakonia cowanii]|uniref:CopD family protein n=1 Tax=Kosakonia cowanii TaxID=208223 RepID=UPI00034C18BC